MGVTTMPITPPNGIAILETSWPPASCPPPGGSGSIIYDRTENAQWAPVHYSSQTSCQRNEERPVGCTFLTAARASQMTSRSAKTIDHASSIMKSLTSAYSWAWRAASVSVPTASTSCDQRSLLYPELFLAGDQAG